MGLGRDVASTMEHALIQQYCYPLDIYRYLHSHTGTISIIKLHNYNDDHLKPWRLNFVILRDCMLCDGGSGGGRNTLLTLSVVKPDPVRPSNYLQPLKDEEI